MGKIYRRQIAFDLSQEELKKYYPRSKFAMSPKYYNEAYADIRRFMKKMGFVHRQGSVYISKNPMTNADVNILVGKLAKEFPWLSQCVKEFDVTSIGTQHSLKKALREVTKAVELNAAPAEKTKTNEPTRMSMGEWRALIEKEKSQKSEAETKEQTKAQEAQEKCDK